MNDAEADLIRRFYEAFDRHDGEAMAACYTSDARFSDPVFPDLRGREPGQMWRMLTERSQDLRVELRAHEAGAAAGSANWVATYTFGPTGRRVVNDVHASFGFRDGLIESHQDRFGFWSWSRQALGPTGALLGWTPLVRSQVRRQAAAQLEQFKAADTASA